MDTLMPISTLVLGWLLGLLGPLIVDRIRSQYSNTEIRKACVVELRDLRYRMISAVYMIEIRLGGLDRQLLEMTRDITKDYKGALVVPELNETLDSMLGYTDQDLAALAQHATSPIDGGLSLKKYHAPYLAAHVGSFGVFDEKLQSAILDVLASLALFNEEVDEARFYFKLTYEPGMSEENHRRASEMIKNTYRNAANRGKTIVERINSIESC